VEGGRGGTQHATRGWDDAGRCAWRGEQYCGWQPGLVCLAGGGHQLWKAYRKRDGTLHRAYLGKSSDLTIDRLSTIAATLATALAPPNRDPLHVSIPAAMLTTSAPMALPTGTLTFLFTDIEGSTQLWEQHPGTMPGALARHDTILRQAVADHGGVVFKTVGDGVHAVFVRASDALEAALAAQQGLHIEGWGETGPLRVRMALHSGVAELRDGDYFGAAVNRVARLLALGHGGQILLSHATHDLVADDLPVQIIMRELGAQALKDLSRPENVFQVVTPDVPADFPPLRSLDAQPARSPPATPLLATKESSENNLTDSAILCLLSKQSIGHR
jgi:class 3 adenylate cyclase